MGHVIATNQGASADALERLRKAYPSLPRAYFDFLARTNGAEGELGVEPGWFVVWSAEEALSATDEYEIPRYLPGYFCFGGNGGGELFVVPIIASNNRQPAYMVPAIGMATRYLTEIAASFDELAVNFGKVLQVVAP